MLQSFRAILTPVTCCTRPMDPILVRRQMQRVATPQSSKQDFLLPREALRMLHRSLIYLTQPSTTPLLKESLADMKVTGAVWGATAFLPFSVLSQAN